MGDKTGIETEKALSVRQPWAWLIVHGFKPIENRDWPTKRRGRVLIHASKGMTRDEYDEVREFVAGVCGDSFFAQDGEVSFAAFNTFPAFEKLERGGIVGAVDIVDCVTSHPSRFFFGKFGFVLANAEVLPFRPYKGALGFFEVKEHE